MIEYTVKVHSDFTEWFLNGLRHREDGPAVERSNGTKEWWVNGLRHREDGPAVERSNGTKEWWVNDTYMFEKDHRRLTTPIKEMTVADVETALGYPVKIVK